MKNTSLKHSQHQYELVQYYGERRRRKTYLVNKITADKTTSINSKNTSDVISLSLR